MTGVANPFVRAARVEDAAAIASVHIASSDEAYAPLAARWHAADAVARAAMWAKSLAEADGRFVVLVAEDTDGAVIGFVSGGDPRRADTAAECEVYAIHVHPSCRGQGVGDALWTAACCQVRGVELASMYVDTLAELRCCSFYERHGGVVVERRPTEFHGAARTHVTYRWARGTPSGTRASRGDLQP